ncbi:hypothetical protein I3843_Q059100, partial [Carya illinoinensis]
QQAIKLLLGVLVILSAAIFVATAVAEPNSNCVTTCGSLHGIPYPFGTSEGCCLNSSFLITYKSSSSSGKSTQTPFLGDSTIKVLSISLDGELRVSASVAHDCSQKLDNYAMYNLTDIQLEFPMSDKNNVFIVVGCGTRALIMQESYEELNAVGCLSRCDNNDGIVDESCSGGGCCQASIPPGMKNFTVYVSNENNDSSVRKFNPCGFAFVVEKKEYKFSTLDLQNMQNKDTCEHAKKDHTRYACKLANSECYNSINGHGYRCNCSSGYHGNPYLSGGCKDIIDECGTQNHGCAADATCVNHVGFYTCLCPKEYEGDGRKEGTACRAQGSDSRKIMIALCISISLLVLLRKLIKLQEKYFQQNGGLLLQEHILNHGRSMETTKIFSNDELKKATNNYDESRVIGKGGYGIVYKGVLPDNGESQIELFINEVILLSQINHRNVVKLIGCCLETEVPLLVYEFITNGTLSDHIHDISRASSLSWEKRLKIAIETTRALAYLHSETSMPIIHRDVKSTNILLDDNHTAKVADFGASRLIALDQTEITTLVQGTLGYLDPEYFQTGQLTEKSDVYSFGVVLAVLLTGEKAISIYRPETYKNLAMYFVSAMKEDRLFHILEDHIVNEGNIEPLKEVANLAKGCLRLRGEDRPTMMEVAMELEGLRIMEKHPLEKDNQTTEEMEYLLNTPTLSFNIDNGASSSVSAVGGHDSMTNRLLKTLDDGR